MAPLMGGIRVRRRRNVARARAFSKIPEAAFRGYRSRAAGEGHTDRSGTGRGPDEYWLTIGRAA